MEFRLLGPFEAWHDSRRVDVGHARQRCVLAVLALEAGQVIPAAALIDRVWAHEPPNGPLNALYTYVRRLRIALEPYGVRLVSRSGGYVLDVAADAVDVFQFRRLVADAAAAGNADQSAAILDRALSLWRGQPFVDVPSPWLAEIGDALTRQRLSALLDRNDAYLRCGRHAELVDELETVVTAHPTDERPVAQLMLALYRSGRPADALDQYQLARQRIVERLGTEPTLNLRRLHRRLLLGDPALQEAAAPRHRSLPVPAGLPQPVPGFVGRQTELAQLSALASPANKRRTVIVSALDGTAGVGKTALAVYWAHLVKAHFPDGNLYADLRAYGPGPVATPQQVLDGFLAALDVAPTKIPVNLDAKAALYRSLLDRRRMLIVLDNAATAEQVRPLLPGSADCLVIVTSRRALSGLVARDRAHRLSLGVLPLAEAVALLAQFIGADRVAAEPDAARELALLCARLPVALCVAGERAASQPDLDLATLVTQLATGSRLDLLDADGDVETAVRAVLSWSYEALPAETRRTFRLLGLHPGGDFDAYAAAALSGVDLDEARRRLALLSRAHLIEPTTPSRYTMHDLLRVYAVERATIEDAAGNRTALTRLLDYYLATAAAATDVLVPAERHRRPHIDAATTPTPSITDVDTARAWLDAELATLVDVAGYAADNEWPGHTVRLSMTLFRYLDTGAHYNDAVTIHSHAHSAARVAGDRTSEAHALSNLGGVYYRLTRYQQAIDCQRQALVRFRETGDALGEGRALYNLGLIHWQRGDYQQTGDYYRQALDPLRRSAARPGEARALGGLGVVCERLGQLPQAEDYLRRALVLFRDTKDRFGEAATLGNFGTIQRRRGDYEQAIHSHRLALSLSRELGYRGAEADALIELGMVYQLQGAYDQAINLHGDALAIFRQMGDEPGETASLNRLGEALHAAGRDDEARRHHETALGLAVENRDRYEQARAHDSLAHIYLSAGDRADARHHWQEALAIYTDLGIPEANSVGSSLATLEP